MYRGGAYPPNIDSPLLPRERERESDRVGSLRVALSKLALLLSRVYGRVRVLYMKEGAITHAWAELRCRICTQ